MSTAAEMQVLWTEQDKLKRAAEMELRAIVNRYGSRGPDAIKAALLEALPALSQKYGTAMSAVAGEWFEATVQAPVVIPDLDTWEQAEQSVRWAVGDLYAGGALGSTMSKAQGALFRYALEGSRATVRASSEKAQIGYARVLRGSENCAFCVMLAGRDILYNSPRGAKYVVGRGKTPVDTKPSHASQAKGIKTRGKQPLGEKFHDGCDCGVMPIRSADDWPKGYDIDGIQAKYRDALDHASSMDIRVGEVGKPRDLDDMNVLQAMRELHKLP